MMDIRRTTKQWVTPSETADYLGVSTRTVCRLADSGDLTCVRVRSALRVNVDSIRRFEHRQMQRFALEG